jgi:hypothetical protein
MVTYISHYPKWKRDIGTSFSFEAIPGRYIGEKFKLVQSENHNYAFLEVIYRNLTRQGTSSMPG